MNSYISTEISGAEKAILSDQADINQITRDFVNANVWDGDDLSGNKNSWAKFTPDDLQELFDDYVDYLRTDVIQDSQLQACPVCSAVPDTHRKAQVRHLHCKSQGMVRFIEQLQVILGFHAGFRKMLTRVQDLEENHRND